MYVLPTSTNILVGGGIDPSVKAGIVLDIGTVSWDKAASIFQKWIADRSVLAIRSTFAEYSGEFNVLISGVIAARSSFLVGLSERSGTAEKQVAVDLTGCEFSFTESVLQTLPSVFLSAVRLTGESISFSAQE